MFKSQRLTDDDKLTNVKFVETVVYTAVCELS